MDVNSTRFHLLRGEADWQRCQESPGLVTSPWQSAAWDAQHNAVTLQPALTLFRHKQTVPLSIDLRRGAARDAYGNQFWIAQNRQEIVWIPSANSSPVSFWTQSVTSFAATADQFHPTVSPSLALLTLAGMAVNSAQYLVVGYTGGPAGEKGVLLFDLRAGGPPTRLIFPAPAVFDPFDMAADADGNVWILDRTHGTYWGLDREFRLIGKSAGPASAPPDPPVFVPNPPLPPGPLPVVNTTPTEGFPLAGATPVGIEALPDGTLLILDTPGGVAPSRLYRYHLADLIGTPLDLVAELKVVTDGTNETADHLDVRGYDLAFQAQSNSQRGVLFIVEQDGNQVIAFDTLLDKAAPPAAYGLLTLQANDAYLPLLYFGGRALLAVGADIYYDVTVGTDRDGTTRWVTLQSIDQPHFAQEALLYTPIFDGKTQDCVWHRLFLDACVPADTTVEIASRAANSLELLAATAFRPEPPLYLRGAGAEIPYYDPFPGNTDADRGVYETLFQEAQGQYLQLQLHLTGNGRATPVLSHLRAYYPRFSYPRHYLPALYLEDAESLSFLERMLANPEGFYSEIEGKIEKVSALFDARSAPPETLDWLAGWMGLLVDPLWQTIQQRRADAAVTPGTLTTAGGVSQTVPDRRRLLIRYARHLYERRGTLEGLRFALHLLLDSCLETTLARLKVLAVLPDPGNAQTVAGYPGVGALVRDLDQYGVPRPTPVSSDADLEDLLYQLVAAPDRPSTIRIVERYRTRGGRAAVEGDPTAGSAPDTPPTAVAHRFTVLIPQGLLPEEEAMVTRIIELEKPAHTQYDVRYYWEGFRVGEARLGIDTLLGQTPTYLPILLGTTALTEGYLNARSPMDAPDRLISDRDRVGDMPAL